jgi:N,N-dimethylformamidase
MSFGMRGTRRFFLQTAVMTAAAAVLPASLLTSTTPALAQTGPGYDPLQRFIFLVPGPDGTIFAVQADGTMCWFRNTGYATGAATWANGGSAKVIGSGWNVFTTLLGDGAGTIFALSASGTMSWYRYDCTNLSTGAGSWAAGSGDVIGSGWQAYPRVFGGIGGSIYAVTPSGGLYLYAWGPSGWENGGAGQSIASGWQVYRRVFNDAGGVIYAVDQGGDLNWFQYANGAWANAGNPVVVGTSWGEAMQKTAWAGGTAGVIYAVTLDADQLNGTDGTLDWFQLSNWNAVTTGGTWTGGGAALTVGSGFTFEPTAMLQGYNSGPSVRQGGVIAFAVSTTFSSYTWEIQRLSGGAPVTVMGPTGATGKLQVLPSGYRANGCGWGNSFSFTVPASWQSGVYAAVLTSPHGQQHSSMFVVTPSQPSASLAFIVPVNTYNAYNCWAGHSRYDSQDGVNDVTLTFQRPSTTTQAVAPSGMIDHTLLSDLFLLNWMAGQGIAADFWTDADMNPGTLSLTPYKAVILGSHPEYWTDPGRAALMSYLSAGGGLIAPGGNTLYERMTTGSGPAGQSVTYHPIGDRDIFLGDGEPEAQAIGAAYNSDVYMTFGPYTVQDAAHPAMAGVTAPVFGSAGYNGGAAGWEVNGPLDPALVQGTATLLASGNGAAMCWLALTGGGWVFAANSIAFNGSIPGDVNIPVILKNVFALAAASAGPSAARAAATIAPRQAARAVPQDTH